MPGIRRGGFLLCIFLIGLVILQEVSSVPSRGISCLDENGGAVDWWIILKLPLLPSCDDPKLNSGFAYAYADVNSPTLALTGRRLDDPNASLTKTLGQVYNAGQANLAWIMYNDQPPNGTATDTYGHTKGLTAYTSNNGFWIAHSTPQYPPPQADQYSFPLKEYGQSFICLTLGLDALNDVGNAFLLNRPYVYDSNIPDGMSGLVPSMAQVVAKKFNSKTPLSNATSVSTYFSGMPFVVFSRNAKWDSDLYSDLVEPYYKSGLLVESWMNGAATNKMPTFCAGANYAYSSINVRQVSFNTCATWLETKDHSKWAISIAPNSNVFCVGDTNRQFSMAKRGGGTVCARNATMLKSFKAIISAADSC